jgi:hypothetical protein
MNPEDPEQDFCRVLPQRHEFDLGLLLQLHVRHVGYIKGEGQLPPGDTGSELVSNQLRPVVHQAKHR